MLLISEVEDNQESLLVTEAKAEQVLLLISEVEGEQESLLVSDAEAE